MEQERKLNPMTIKSFTDLEQSKKLVEFLPLESADMVYIKHSSSYNPTWEFNEDFPPMILGRVPINKMTVEVLPCWSLAALLDIYPMVVGRDMDMYCCWQNHKNLHSKHYNNPIDACVEMIEKLHKQNIL